MPFMDFWSVNLPKVDVAQGTPANYALNPVVVANLPSNAVISRVVAALQVDYQLNQSAMTGTLSGRLSVDADSGFVSTLEALSIPSGSFYTSPLDLGSPSLLLEGNADVKSEVTGNGTYYFRLENAVAVSSGAMNLYGVSVRLRVYFDVPVEFMDFWGTSQANLTIPSTEGNVALGNVVVSGIPSGTSIQRAVLMVKASIIEANEGNFEQLGAASASTVVVVADNAEFTGKLSGISIMTSNDPRLGQLYVEVISCSYRQGGAFFVGDVDVSSIVAGDGTYYLRFENIKARFDGLILYEVQFGIRVYYQQPSTSGAAVAVNVDGSLSINLCPKSRVPVNLVI